METKSGLISVSLVWAIVQIGILSVTAHISFVATQCDCTEYWGLPQGYVGVIESLAICLIIGLSALLGYVVNDFRRGLMAFLLAGTIALVSTSPLLLVIQSSPFTGPYDLNILDLARSQSFDALDPRILSSSYWAPLFVLGLILLLLLVGIVAVFVGSLVRELGYSFEDVRLDWRFLAVGQLLNSVAVFWSVPTSFVGYVGQSATSFLGFDFSPFFGSWALPIISAFIVASLFLIIYGLRSRSTSSAAYAGLMAVGSFVVMLCSIIALGYAVRGATAQAGPCYMSASACEAYQASVMSQTQNFLMITLLLTGSLAFSGLIISRLTLFLRK